MKMTVEGRVTPWLLHIHKHVTGCAGSGWCLSSLKTTSQHPVRCGSYCSASSQQTTLRSTSITLKYSSIQLKWHYCIPKRTSEFRYV